MIETKFLVGFSILVTPALQKRPDLPLPATDELPIASRGGDFPTPFRLPLDFTLGRKGQRKMIMDEGVSPIWDKGGLGLHP